ncbi:MAG TPA: MerR family DNA-binding transcriptional regulator [Ktedonobacteraceae bacterium]|nr:MerR family DNA-binding transcriptional regulator [Ktedonobacteraceae bacterium]
MKTLLHIGEIAQLLGVTPKTIRHYHKIGLLNLGTTSFIAMILLLWKLPPVPALIAFVILDIAIITGMWRFGQAQLWRTIQKG